jgi:hypothetical protein
MKIISLVAAGVTLGLCGCGDRQEPAAGSPAATGAAGTQGPAQVRTGDGAVAGVLESTGPAVASLWFEVVERPVAGQPFTLKLQLSAAQPLPSLEVAVGSEGLKITPERASLALAEASTPVSHELTVTAPEAGLFDLRVRLVAGEQGAESLYAIPVLVAAAE